MMIACSIFSQLKISFIHQNETSIIKDSCCHLTLCLDLSEPSCNGYFGQSISFKSSQSKAKTRKSSNHLATWCFAATEKLLILLGAAALARRHLRLSAAECICTNFWSGIRTNAKLAKTCQFFNKSVKAIRSPTVTNFQLSASAEND